MINKLFKIKYLSTRHIIKNEQESFFEYHNTRVLLFHYLNTL